MWLVLCLQPKDASSYQPIKTNDAPRVVALHLTAPMLCTVLVHVG
jgi:hypothetical protein